jgi:hypothetical protein
MSQVLEVLADDYSAFYQQQVVDIQKQVDDIADAIAKVCEGALSAGPIWRPKVVIAQSPGLSVLQTLADGWYWYDKRSASPFVGPLRSRIEAGLSALLANGVNPQLLGELLNEEQSQDLIAWLGSYRKLLAYHKLLGNIGTTPTSYGDLSALIFDEAGGSSEFDATEVHAFRFSEPSADNPEGIAEGLTDGTTDDIGDIEEVDDFAKANFFSTFLHFKTGGVVTCGDFVTAAEAYLCAFTLDRDLKFLP